MFNLSKKQSIMAIVIEKKDQIGMPLNSKEVTEVLK